MTSTRSSDQEGGCTVVRTLMYALGAMFILFAGVLLVNDCAPTDNHFPNDPVHHNRAVLKEKYGVPMRRRQRSEQGEESGHTNTVPPQYTGSSGYDQPDVRHITVRSLLMYYVSAIHNPTNYQRIA